MLLTYNNEYATVLFVEGGEGSGMYKVITYKDRAGNDEIAAFIQELNSKIDTNKDARIRYKNHGIHRSIANIRSGCGKARNRAYHQYGLMGTKTDQR